MLKVFYGTDRTAVRDAAQKECETAGVTPTIVEDTTYVSGAVASAVGAASLFGGVECFVLDTPSGDDDFESEVSVVSRSWLLRKIFLLCLREHFWLTRKRSTASMRIP